jgi:hypothetical protein
MATLYHVPTSPARWAMTWRAFRRKHGAKAGKPVA